MATGEVLYVKGMNMSESGEDFDDPWDDKKLNDAYDRALKVANVEVAKRLAQATNTQHGAKDGHSKSKKEKSAPRPSSSKIIDITWKEGMPCRAIYDDDGQEYEAFVLKIINDTECIVRFLGYENSEVVPINTLKPTLGSRERARQVEEALSEKGDDGFGSQSPHYDRMDCGSTGFESTEKSYKMNKPKKSKKKSRKNSGVGVSIPGMPGLPGMMPPLPDMNIFRNMESEEMPLPPPPATLGARDSEDQALSSMLLSWYMSGYYTGLYQGFKRAKEQRHRN